MFFLADSANNFSWFENGIAVAVLIFCGWAAVWAANRFLLPLRENFEKTYAESEEARKTEAAARIKAAAELADERRQLIHSVETQTKLTEKLVERIASFDARLADIERILKSDN